MIIETRPDRRIWDRVSEEHVIRRQVALVLARRLLARLQSPGQATDAETPLSLTSAPLWLNDPDEFVRSPVIGRSVTPKLSRSKELLHQLENCRASIDSTRSSS